MKKRIIYMLLCAAMTAALAVGCGTKEESTKAEEKADTGSTEEVSDVKADAVDQKKVFVTPEWVQSVIDGNQEESEDYVILEASWGTYKDSPDYTDGHLPGALHVDIASVESEPYWNLSDPDVIEKGMLDLGITKDKTVILYGSDVSGTCRVAYAYLWAGVENVKVLNGGLDAWKAAGYKLETEVEKAEAAEAFGTTVPAHPEYWLSVDDVKDKLENNSNFKLVSIRSEAEFLGETSGYSYIDKAGEPKGAVWGYAGSDPYHMEDYTHEDNTYITMEEMEELWADCDFTTENELSFYCGTGWRATIPWLICYESGMEGMTLYDGGWYQWQMDDALPVQVGDPAGEDCVYTTAGELSTDKAAK